MTIWTPRNVNGIFKKRPNKNKEIHRSGARKKILSMWNIVFLTLFRNFISKSHFYKPFFMFHLYDLYFYFFLFRSYIRFLKSPFSISCVHMNETNNTKTISKPNVKMKFDKFPLYSVALRLTLKSARVLDCWPKNGEKHIWFFCFRCLVYVFFCSGISVHLLVSALIDSLIISWFGNGFIHIVDLKRTNVVHLAMRALFWYVLS